MLAPGFHAHQRNRGAPWLGEHEVSRHGNVFRPQHAVLVDQPGLVCRWKLGIVEIGPGKARLDQADLDVLFRQFLAQRRGKAWMPDFAAT